MKKYNNADLANEVWNKVYTQVPIDALQRMDKVAEEILANEIVGDIVECGVWAGGAIIYLANLFPERKIWAVDSYEGFQETIDGNYAYTAEVHTKQFGKSLDGSVWIRHAKTFAQTEESVIEHFKEYDIAVPEHVQSLKGYVNETCKPDTCPIKQIALLRVDVDAYSATREVLDYLYDKVSIGGYVVFDDWGVSSADAAVNEYFANKNIVVDNYLLKPPNGGRCAMLKKTMELK